jgi:hypothetical protein
MPMSSAKLDVESDDSLYERDFYAWSLEQARLLRAGLVTQLDLENIAEEIESLGKSEKKELASRLTVLLTHLLKWQLQTGHRSGSWEATIRVQRRDAAEHLRENPSLKSQIPRIFANAYQSAASQALIETGLPATTFPPASPWTFNQAIDPDFWP